MKGAVIYIAGFEEDRNFANGKPCKLCDRMIRNAQIAEVIYLKNDGTLERVEVL